MNIRWKIAQAAEIHWWRRYLRTKDQAAYRVAKQTYWHRVLDQLEIKPQAGDHILDAGCGPAGIFMILNENQVDAVDPLINRYEYLPHFNKNDFLNVRFINKSLELFNSESTYDIIFCMNAINHVADLHKSLDNLIAALAPGGRLVLAVDVHRHDFLKSIFRIIPGDILHPHQDSLEDYLQLLKQRDGLVLKTICLKPGWIFDYFAIIATK